MQKKKTQDFSFCTAEPQPTLFKGSARRVQCKRKRRRIFLFARPSRSLPYSKVVQGECSAKEKDAGFFILHGRAAAYLIQTNEERGGGALGEQASCLLLTFGGARQKEATRPPVWFQYRGVHPARLSRMPELQHTLEDGSPLYIYTYFTLVKILQPFSRPFILADTQQESG